MSGPYNSENLYFTGNDFEDLEIFRTKLASLKLDELSDKAVYNIFKEVIEKGSLDHFKLLENKFKRIKVDLSPEEKISVKLSNNNILDKEITIDRNRKLPLKKYLLDEAVLNCKYEIVKYLVENKKANPDHSISRDYNPLSLAILNHKKIYQQFKESKDRDEVDDDAVLACWNFSDSLNIIKLLSNKEIIQPILEESKNKFFDDYLNKRFDGDKFIFHSAIESRDLEVIKYLVDVGTDINVSAAGMGNALYNLIDGAKELTKDDYKIIDYLLEKNINIFELNNTNDPYSSSIFALAIQKNDIKLLAKLIEQANSNDENKNKFKEFLNIQYSNGHNLMDLAIEYGSGEIIQLINEAAIKNKVCYFQGVENANRLLEKYIQKLSDEVIDPIRNGLFVVNEIQKQNIAASFSKISVTKEQIFSLIQTKYISKYMIIEIINNWSGDVFGENFLKFKNNAEQNILKAIIERRVTSKPSDQSLLGCVIDKIKKENSKTELKDYFSNQDGGQEDLLTFALNQYKEIINKGTILNINCNKNVGFIAQDLVDVNLEHLELCLDNKFELANYILLDNITNDKFKIDIMSKQILTDIIKQSIEQIDHDFLNKIIDKINKANESESVKEFFSTIEIEKVFYDNLGEETKKILKEYGIEPVKANITTSNSQNGSTSEERTLEELESLEYEENEELNEIIQNGDIENLKKYNAELSLGNLSNAISCNRDAEFIKAVISKMNEKYFLLAEKESPSKKYENIFECIKLAIGSNKPDILELIIGKINEKNVSEDDKGYAEQLKQDIKDYLNTNNDLTKDDEQKIIEVINKLAVENLVLKENEKKDKFLENGVTSKTIDVNEIEQDTNKLPGKENEKEPTFVEKLKNNKGKIIAGGLIIAVTAFLGLGAFLLITAFDLKVDKKTFEQTVDFCKKYFKEIASAASGKIQDFKSYAKKSYNQIMNR